MTNLTEKQISVIRCAFADLCGSLQARDQLDIEVHDWQSHKLSIHELKDEFGKLMDAIPEDCL
jgi:hypothetical protein